MKIKLSLYTYNVAEKQKNDSPELSVIVDSSDLLMIYPKSAFGYWYRDDSPKTDKNKLPAITRLYDQSQFGLAKYPYSLVAITYNGNYIPFTDIEIAKGNIKHHSSIYNMVTEEMAATNSKSFKLIDRSKLDFENSEVLNNSYYAQFQKPYEYKLAEDIMVGYVQSVVEFINNNNGIDNYWMLVNKDQSGSGVQNKTHPKFIQYGMNCNRIHKVVNSLYTGYTPEYFDGGESYEYVPGIIFRVTTNDVALQNVQLMTGQATESYTRTLPLDTTQKTGVVATETPFSVPMVYENNTLVNIIKEYKTETDFYTYFGRRFNGVM